MTSNIELDLALEHVLPIIDYEKSIMKSDFRFLDKDIYCQIVNIGNEMGTHWICYYKVFNSVFYYDSFGIKPFKDFINQSKTRGFDVYYYFKRDQEMNEVNCGERCVLKLKQLDSMINSSYQE